MSASALLKFVQGATVGGDGHALVGVLTTSVALSNVNNASVASWQIDLLYSDPTSGVSAAAPYAFGDSSSTPAAVFSPDVRRSFRWRLKVWSVPNRVGEPDSIDIRVFSVRELNGVLIPPSQVWPPPLPDPRSGELNAKPNEMNYAGQLDGWHGTGLDGLLNELLARHMPPTPGSDGEVLTSTSGRWVAAPTGVGSGDVSGPGASVAGNIPVFADTTGKLLADGGLALTAFIRHNGSVAFTGNQSMGGFKLTSVSNGVAAGDAVNLGQLQAAIAGLDPKGNVRAYTTTNVASLTGLGALAGSGVASFTDGQRVGLGGQSTASQNGVWVLHAGAWTRPIDFNTGMDVSGAYFTVEEGTFADRAFLVQNDEGSAVVGTNNLVLIDFGTSSISAGNGLQKVGNVLSILHDGATLSSSVSGLKVAAGGITDTELAVGAVVLSTSKVTGLLPFANIADGAATSVLGRSANTLGVMASIASSADGQVLRRAGGALTFGAVDLADADAVTGALPLTSLPNLAALSVLGRGGNTAGVMAAITGTADQVLAVNTAGNALAFGQVQTGGYATSSVTLAKLADAGASSVLGRSAATAGPYGDILSSADGQVLRRGAAGVVAFGALDLADADAVTGLLPFANLANGSATSVLGRSAGTIGAQASIAATADGQVLQRVAGVLAWAALAVGSITGGTAVGQVLTNQSGNVPTWGAVDLADADAVTGLLPLANMASIAGLSVLGRAANTTGAMAAITGVDGQVLRVSGTTLGFGTIVTAGIADGNVTLAKLAAATASSVLGRSAATPGAYADIASSADGQVLRRGAAGVVAFGAVDLADADAVTGLLPFSNLANLSALSVLGRSTNSVGVMAAITGADGQVLRVSGTTLGFGTITGAGVADATLPLAKLVDGTAASVVGRSAATGGPYADIVSSADGQFLQRVAGVLGWATITAAKITGGTAVGQVLVNGASNIPAWGAVDLADADAVTGLLPFANLASLTGLSVLGRGTNSTGAMAAITGVDGQVLRVAGTALGFGTVVTAGIADGNVTLAKLANATASSVLGRSAATGGAYADIASSADGQVLRRGAAGVVAFGAVDLADADAVTGLLPFLNQPNLNALSVLGRDSNSAGVMAGISASSANQVLRVNAAGTALGFGTIATAGLADASVTMAKLADLAGLSVIGRTANSLGVPAAITATVVGQVLRYAGTTLAFGAIDLSDADAVTGTLGFANMPSLNGLTVLGRSASSSGVMAQIAGGAGQILRVDAGGTALGFGTISGASIDVNTIALSRLAQSVGAPSILGRAAATNGSFGELSATADGQALVRSGGGLTFGAIDLADPDAVTGLLPHGNIASGSAASVFGRAANTSGQQASIISSADGQVLRRAAGVVGWGAVDLADADAIAGLLPLGNFTPSGTNGRVLVTAAGVPVWDTTIGNTSEQFNVLGGIVNLSAQSSLYLQVTSGIMLSAAALGGRVLGILGNVTTTQMPSGTGDQVAFWANTSNSSIPTVAPVGGGIIYNSAVSGLAWRGTGNVVTTLAMHGGSPTTKGRFIDTKVGWSEVQPSGTSVFTACSFTATNYFQDGTLIVRAKSLCFGSASYCGYCEQVALFRVDGGVVTQIAPSQPGFDDAHPGGIGNLGNGFVAASIDNSGTLIRFRVTPFLSLQQFVSYFEVDACEDGI